MGHFSNMWLKPRGTRGAEPGTSVLAGGHAAAGMSPTHLKQWAAVRTHRGSMMLPPQMCSFLYCKLTCQGQVSMAAGLPPSTRGVLMLSPQSSARRQSGSKARR